MILNQINKLCSIVVLCASITLAHAASFDLLLSEQQVANEQSVTLHFKLSDAKANSDPDFSELNQYFDIYSQGTSSSYSLLNGTLSQSITWSLVLLPKHSGKIVIPKISVATNRGTLSTQSAELEVVNKHSAQPQANANASAPSVNSSAANKANKAKDIYLEGDFDAPELYVNQPFVYTLKIFTKLATANMSLNDMHSDDAIIERHGEPVQYNSHTNGVQVNVTEIKYIITPLHAGKMTLNPASLRYEPLNSFFNRYSSGPGTVYSDEEILKVLDIPAKLPPFSKLKIEDVWDTSGKEIHENDSLTRTIKIIGEDGYVDSLKINIPTQTAVYNLYQDKTKETKSLSKTNHVHSEKVINYTIIPLKAGELLIPKTTVRWWNVKNKQVEDLEIPEKKFVILPSSSLVDSVADDLPESSVHSELATNKTLVASKYKTWFMLSAALNLIFMLIYALKWSLKFKKARPAMTLEDVKTLDNLKSYINYFVQDAWKIKGNLPLKDLWSELSKASFVYDKDLAKELASKLNSSLYFKEELQVAKALDLWRKFSITVVKQAPAKQEQYSNKLNPM